MRTDRSKPHVDTPDTGKSQSNPRLVLYLAVAVVLGGAAIWIYAAGSRRGPEEAPTAKAVPAPAPEYTGQSTCATCHAAEARGWVGSDHALAMQAVDDHTVLGDFNDARFTHAGLTSTFYRRDRKFFVRTDGPDGELHDYEIAYVFGVRPLQQYLVAFPDGKLQPLSIAWDSRPASEGGQRWFHLYPESAVRHDDALHWTGRNQTWNHLCAACHTTNLQKNYDLARDSYATTWSEINVSCEACHGPGSQHVAWARSRAAGHASPSDPGQGLLVRFPSKGVGPWVFTDPAQRTARRAGPRSEVEVEACARCHARSRPIIGTGGPGQPLLDTHVPALLDQGLYHADGQILEEVFEYGSFTQSKIYREGVTCSDCHDPHSGKLASGESNLTCSKCHQPSAFDTVEHHRHEPGSAGALCVNCHMPEKNYMVIDARRDHSFRVPRPDLSLAPGTPDACTLCHDKRSREWAAQAVARWYGPNRRKEQHYGTAIDAGRRGLEGAEQLLASVVIDRQQLPIVRATALSLLPDYVSPASLPAVLTALKDEQPLVRAAAVRALEPLPPVERLAAGLAGLADPVRAVRIEAARLLAAAPQESLTAEQRKTLVAALSELVASEMASAERPESHLNLAALQGQMGNLREAEAELQTALRLDARFVPALVNLADLYRAEGRDDAGEKLLRQAISIAPSGAEATHGLGLLLVRQGRQGEALNLLKKAAALEPNSARYSLVYGLALQASGALAAAAAALEQAAQRHPANRELLMALVAVERQRQNLQGATRYAERLQQLAPADPGSRASLHPLRQPGAVTP